MSSRIIAMRKTLFEELNKLQTPGNWEHIVKQIGMFSYLGIKRIQKKNFHFEAKKNKIKQTIKQHK